MAAEQADGWKTDGAGAADKKKAGSVNCLPEEGGDGSDVGLGLAQTLHTVAGLPLTALFQEVDALEALEDVAFDDEAGSALETFVLRHDFEMEWLRLVKGVEG
jgi:hypothetical protein